MADFYELTPAEQAERLRARARGARIVGSRGTRAHADQISRERGFRVAASDGRRYAIRVHRAGYHSDAELRSELQWMRALSGRRFRCARARY